MIGNFWQCFDSNHHFKALDFYIANRAAEAVVNWGSKENFCLLVFMSVFFLQFCMSTFPKMAATPSRF